MSVIMAKIEIPQIQYEIQTAHSSILESNCWLYNVELMLGIMLYLRVLQPSYSPVSRS